MREILFKAKRLDNSEWVTGDLTQDRDLDQCFISGWDYYTDYSGLQREPFEYQVDTGTVCQYTGLIDKNGAKIFEGDIVKHYNNCPIQEYSIDTGRVFWYQPTQRYLRTSSIFPDECAELFEWSECEVIGNIYDKEEDHGKQ